MIKLGDKVKDKVTEFTGIVMVRADYLSGCIQFCVKPDRLDKDGKMLKGQYEEHKN